MAAGAGDAGILVSGVIEEGDQPGAGRRRKDSSDGCAVRPEDPNDIVVGIRALDSQLLRWRGSADANVTVRSDAQPLCAVGEHDNWVVVDAIQARGRGSVVDTEKEIDVSRVVEVFGPGVASRAGILEPRSGLSR